MSHLYKSIEWQDATGNWLVNDTTSMTSIAIKWWVPMRMFNLTPEDYIHLLKDKFHVNYMKYVKDADLLIFSFATQEAARKYKNWINKEARNRNYIID